MSEATRRGSRITGTGSVASPLPGTKVRSGDCAHNESKGAYARPSPSFASAVDQSAEDQRFAT